VRGWEGARGVRELGCGGVGEVGGVLVGRRLGVRIVYWQLFGVPASYHCAELPC